MTRKLTFLILALFTLIAGPGWGQSREALTTTLTNANIVAAGDANSSYANWDLTDDNDFEYHAYAIKNKHSNATSSYHFLQIKKYASNTAYYIQLPMLPGAIQSINMTVSSSSKPMTDGGNSATLYFSNSNSTSSAGDGVASGTGDSSVTIDASSLNLNTGYITASGAVRIWDIEITYLGTPSTTPSITVDPTSIDLGTVNINEEAEATFTVSQANLTNGITLNAENGNLDVTSIVAGAGDTEVTYTITPNAAGEFSDVITISCTDLENDIEINVSGNAIDPSVVETYELYSGSLEEGDYVVYYNGKAMKNTISSNRLDYTEVTPANNVISNPDAAIVWHIAPSGDYWTIYNASVSKYAAGNGTKNQAALSSDGTDDGSLWTVNGTATYDFTNKKNTSSSVNATLRNNGTYGFACYGTGTGAPLSLYKKVNSSSVATPTFTPAGGTYTTAQNVTISCETEGASIYYTLDGSTPTNASTLYTSAIAVNETTTVKAIAYVGEESSNVATATYTIVAPLTSITVTGTAADLWKGDAFSHEGITVTANWGDNTQTDVTNDATYSGYDMNTAGEQTVTVTYMEKTASYNVTVQTIANTQATAYTIAQAIAIIDAGKDLNSEVYVAGTISQLDENNNAPQYKNLTYWITDESSETEFEVFRGRNLNNTDFNSNNDIEIGADVIVFGKIAKYQSTYEFSQGNYLVSYTAPQVDKYDINLNHNEYGTISADLATASAGQTVTLTAIPIEHYHFVEWTVLDGDANEVPVTNNQFVMPASDVEVEATFEEDESVVFTYHYNGEEYLDGIDYEGTVITLEEDPELSPVGFSFVGWSTSIASTDVIVNTTYTLSEDVDFYAVFEKASSSKGQAVTIIDGSQLTSTVTSQDTEMSFDGKTIVVSEGAKQTDVAGTAVNNFVEGSAILIGKNGKYIYNTTAFDNITKFEIYSHKGASTNVAIGVTFSDSPISEYDAESANTWTATLTQNDEVYDASSKLPANAKYFWYQVTNSYNSQVQFRITYGNGSNTTSRYTRVYDDVYSFEGGDLTVEGPSIVVSGYTLNVSGDMSNTNPANLIIEDGAQLIQNSSNVKATVLKNITGYTGDNDNYYLIANPTAINVEEDDYDALDGCTTFDLYTFDPTAELEWVNIGQTAQKVTFDRNVGYLYANAQDMTLHFRGYLLPTNETTNINLVYYTGGEASREFPGFNLIGNPYTCNAYVNGYNFYTMSDGEFVINEGSATIAPCEGFFVEATEANQSVTVSTAAPVTAPNALSLNVSQNRGNVIDRAIVNFNGSNNLHKFMLNPAHTNLSIAKGGETFAAISTEAEGELPVNFKAEKNGTYTITVNTKNVDAEYLHLIDNMTGMDVDLLSTPSYTFEAKTSDYASRFKLVFGVNNTASESSDSNFAFMSDGNLVIDNIDGEATLQIVDELGRVISTETVSGSYNKALNLKAGLYILNLNGMTQKIVVE